ncbi:putative protein, FluMu gp41 family [Campylobacter iguaniorum]|uniref:phage tail assembly protein n=1 Tax=Campylobacter iguaniorum TaxID=1244531 RepID=UPI00073A4AF6|nr:phage tail assembly protein [Campylobacter iguaniorum]ALV25038.1 putative protein, FluMu gp41 family [Campylobacter iguaniorum]
MQIKINGKNIEMREPKVRDMRIVSQINNPADKELSLISNLTGLSSDELDELNMKEYAKLQKGLQDFL